jgi:hypothetical protein
MLCNPRSNWTSLAFSEQGTQKPFAQRDLARAKLEQRAPQIEVAAEGKKAPTER